MSHLGNDDGTDRVAAELDRYRSWLGLLALGSRSIRDSGPSSTRWPKAIKGC
jgi:hypothetical protein